MTANNISADSHDAATITLFDIISTQQDAEEWASLLDDFLGPENDIYSRLQQSSERKAKLSS